MGAMETLCRLVEIASALDAERIRVDAYTTAARISAGRFFVAVIGQFKRGKSTLINALLGEPILPVGVTPVTSVITIVRHGTDRQAIVRFESGDAAAIDVARVLDYVTEAGNPGNAKQVTTVEVLLPSSALASGMCLWCSGPARHSRKTNSKLSDSDVLETLTTRIEELLEDLTPLLSEAERKLTEYFAHAWTTYTASVVEDGKRILRTRLVHIQHEPRFREKAFEVAEGVARDFVLEWLRRAEPDALQLFRGAVSRVTGQKDVLFHELDASDRTTPVDDYRACHQRNTVRIGRVRCPGLLHPIARNEFVTRIHRHHRATPCDFAQELQRLRG